MNIRTLLGTLALGAAVVVPSLANAQEVIIVNGYRHHFHERAKGVIAAIDKTTITLRNGRHIFLQNGTVINPTGRPLRVGQLIDVFGPPGGEGAINAREIDIIRGARYGGM
jgi:hypothetical protein